MSEETEAPELTPEQEIEKSLPAFSLMTEEGKELVRKSLKRFNWVVSFMSFQDMFNFQILSRMQKTPSMQIDTMGVRPLGFNIQLTFNPVFVSKLTDEQLRWVLGHEVLHVVLHHTTKRGAKDPGTHKLQNWGADLAINSLQPSGNGKDYPVHNEDIKDKSGKVVSKKGTPWVLLPAGFGFAEKCSMEQYIQLLQDKYKDNCPKCGKKHKDKGAKDKGKEDEGDQDGGQEGDGAGGDKEGDKDDNGKKGKGKGKKPGEGKGGKGEGEGEGGQGEGEGEGEGDGCGGDEEGEGCGGDGCECDETGRSNFDDHSGWDKNSIADSQVREWIRDVDSKKAWGNMSAEMQEQIRAAQKAEVNWVGQLKHYYGQISTSSTRATYKRPSRRMWYPWTGKVRETKDRKLVGIDDSGSVSSKMLGKFLAETNRLSQIQPVDMISWDAGLTMSKAIPWEKKKLNFAFQGRGGTDPQPCLDYAKEHGYKECIMLSDGFFSMPKKPAGVRVLWVITPDGTTENLPPGCKVIKMVYMPD